jgi:hypothetical protein
VSSFSIAVCAALSTVNAGPVDDGGTAGGSPPSSGLSRILACASDPSARRAARCSSSRQGLDRIPTPLSALSDAGRDRDLLERKLARSAARQCADHWKAIQISPELAARVPAR